MKGVWTMVVADEFDLMRNFGGFRPSYKALGTSIRALRHESVAAWTGDNDTSVSLVMMTGTATPLLVEATKELLGFVDAGSYTYITPSPVRWDLPLRVHLLGDSGATAASVHVDPVASIVIGHATLVLAENERTAPGRKAAADAALVVNADKLSQIEAKLLKLNLVLGKYAASNLGCVAAKKTAAVVDECRRTRDRLREEAKSMVACHGPYGPRHTGTLVYSQNKTDLRRIVDGAGSAGTIVEAPRCLRTSFVKAQATDPRLDLSIEIITGDENQNEKRRSLDAINAKTGGVMAGTASVGIGTNMPMDQAVGFGVYRTATGLVQFVHRVDRRFSGLGKVLLLFNCAQWLRQMQLAVARVAVTTDAAANAGQGASANARPAVLAAKEAAADLADFDAVMKVLLGSQCYVLALNRELSARPAGSAAGSSTCQDRTSDPSKMCSACAARHAGMRPVNAVAGEPTRAEFVKVLASLPRRFGFTTLVTAIRKSTVLNKHFKRLNDSKFTGRKQLVTPKTVALQFVMMHCATDRGVDLPPLRKRPENNPEHTSTKLSFLNPKAKCLVQTEGLQSCATGTLPDIVIPLMFSKSTFDENVLGKSDPTASPTQPLVSAIAALGPSADHEGCSGNTPAASKGKRKEKPVPDSNEKKSKRSRVSGSSGKGKENPNPTSSRRSSRPSSG